MLRQVISTCYRNRQSISRIIHKTCSTQTSNQVTCGFIKVAETWGCWTTDVHKAVELTPELKHHSTNQVHTTFSTLGEFGFTAGQILKIVCQYPDALKFDPVELNTRLEYWKQCQMTEDDVKTLINEHPILLSYPPDYVRKKVGMLRQVLHHSKMFKVLLISPTLMDESFSDLQAKLNYLMMEMKVDLETIVTNSAILAVSLWQIKSRHLFFFRAGEYKTPNPKASVPVKNPNLTHMLSADIEYALKGIPLSSEEFAVFETMLKMEEDDEDIDDSDEYDSE